LRFGGLCVPARTIFPSRPVSPPPSNRISCAALRWPAGPCLINMSRPVLFVFPRGLCPAPSPKTKRQGWNRKSSPAAPSGPNPSHWEEFDRAPHEPFGNQKKVAAKKSWCEGVGLWSRKKHDYTITSSIPSVDIPLLFCHPGGGISADAGRILGVELSVIFSAPSSRPSGQPIEASRRANRITILWPPDLSPPEYARPCRPVLTDWFPLAGPVSLRARKTVVVSRTELATLAGTTDATQCFHVFQPLCD